MFIGEKPILPQTIEDLSTKATDEELREAFVDEWGVKYSKDGRRLLKAPYELNGTYSIRKGIKIICDEAFADCKFIGCRSLTSLVIPDSVTNIGDYAFWNCRSLTDIVIPDGVTSIGKCAFEGCSALSSVVIPDSVSCIGFGAFENCSSLHSVVIPDSVTSIGESAFYDCESLSSLVIPDSVASIGDNAFSGCSSLSSVVIPESVVNLNGNPFCRWDGELKCLSPYFIYDNKVLFDKDKSKIIALRDNNSSLIIQ